MNQMTDATWEIRDVLLPTGVRATIRIQGKKIVAVGFTSLCDRYLDGSNLEIYPGFRNVHVHFRQPGWEYRKTVFSTKIVSLADSGKTCDFRFGSPFTACSGFLVNCSFMA